MCLGSLTAWVKITMEKIGRKKCLIDPKFLKYLKTGCGLGDINHNNWKLSDLGSHSSPQEASPREGTGSVSLHITSISEIFVTHTCTSLSCIITVFHTSEVFKYLRLISLRATFNFYFNHFHRRKKNFYKIPVSLSFDKLENTKSLTWIFFIFTHKEALCIGIVTSLLNEPPSTYTQHRTHTHTHTHTHTPPHGSSFVEST